jgi:hypothetical protein
MIREFENWWGRSEGGWQRFGDAMRHLLWTAEEDPVGDVREDIGSYHHVERDRGRHEQEYTRDDVPTRPGKTKPSGDSTNFLRPKHTHAAPPLYLSTEFANGSPEIFLSRMQVALSRLQVHVSHQSPALLRRSPTLE